MATGALGIKLRCASWQQLATIYKRDLSRGSMFLKASTPPPLGTSVRIDLTLPSGSVIVLNGTVQQHVNDPQRGAGVELKLAPIPTGSIWLIESALASEAKRTGGTGSVAAVTTGSMPVVSPPGAKVGSTTGSTAASSSGTPVPIAPTASGPIMSTGDGEDVAAAEVDLIRALVAEAESLKKLNPFLVLGLGYEASDADVRAAFAELTKRYHPDRFARYQSTELRQVAAEIFILIRDAYRRLGDEAGRHSVLSSLGRAGQQRTIQVPVVKSPATPPAGTAVAPPPSTTQTVPTTQPVPPVPKVVTQKLPADLDPPQTPRPRPPDRPDPARAPTEKPVGAIRGVIDQNRPPSAASAKKQETTRSKPVTQAPVGISEATDATRLEELLDDGRVEEALAGYRVLSKKLPQDRSMRAGIELCEGLLAMAQRDRLEAAQRFEAALEIDPSNERAARELADMRRQATNERKGLLSRLMGKKE